MRRLLLIGGLALATAIPAAASAETRCAPSSQQRATGTVLGAIAGGVIGSQLAERGSRGTGTALGAVGGAIIGNQIAGSGGDCPDGYYAYDDRYDRDQRDANRYDNSYNRGYDNSYNRSYDNTYANSYSRDAYDRSSDGYDSRSYDGQDGAGQSWRDEYGRSCHWRAQAYTGEDGYTRYREVQDCR